MTQHFIIVRQFTEDHWNLWRDIRLEALQSDPDAFGSTYEEEAYSTESDWRLKLRINDVFAVCVGENIVGVGCFTLNNTTKTRHKGKIWGVYIRPDFRGNGLSNNLIERLVEHAKTRCAQVHLAVNTSNRAAIALYQKHGFEIYGTEPRALKIHTGMYLDDALMVLRFDVGTEEKLVLN